MFRIYLLHIYFQCGIYIRIAGFMHTALSFPVNWDRVYFVHFYHDILFTKKTFILINLATLVYIFCTTVV